MTKLHNLKLNALLLLITAAITGSVFSLYINNKADIRLDFMLPVTASYQGALPTITPAPEITTFSQISPDGVRVLTMTVTAVSGEAKYYKFIASGPDDKEKLQIFEIRLPNTDKMSVPFNSWSPDNKYVFIEERLSDKNSALVFKADGKPVSDGEKYLDVRAIFDSENTGNIYQETTGWASETLLIVNSIKADGSKGPSYWLEVPSKAVIRLSTEF